MRSGSRARGRQGLPKPSTASVYDVLPVFRRGHPFDLLERARYVLDVGEAQLHGGFRDAVPFAEQLGHLFDALLDDIVVDRPSHALLEPLFEQPARQRHQLHQVVDLDLAADILMDVFQYFGDMGVVVGENIRGLAGHDVGGMDHDVFPCGARIAHELVDQQRHVVAALFDILAERRKVRRGEAADRFVVVHAQDGYIVRDAAISPPPRPGGRLP